MSNSNFNQWLADIFGQNDIQISELLNDKTAVQFLIAWSLFENRFFNGYMQISDIEPRSKRLIENDKLDISSIFIEARYFHERYQDKELYKNLFFDKPCQQIDAILKLPVANLSPVQIVVLSIYVAYRFRNNVFHGNKGVSSWLKFNDQIVRCTHIMRLLISHVETLEPTFK